MYSFVPRTLSPYLFADSLTQTVYNAIKSGYRLFDGAADYGNEKEAGEGIARAIKDGLVTREDVCKWPPNCTGHVTLSC